MIRPTPTQTSTSIDKTPGKVTAGLDYYTFKAVTLNLLEAGSVAVYGRKDFGKSNLLKLIVDAAARIDGVQFVCWEDGRKELDKVLSPGIAGYDADRVFGSYKDFLNYLNSANLIRSDPDKKSCEFVSIEQRAFTVFIIQSRRYYLPQTGEELDQTAAYLFPLVNSAAENRALFVFSDVQRMAALEVQRNFSYGIKHAFLLDDIAKFVLDKGKHSVFESLDHQFLKEEFGPVEKGDGFYYDVDADQLRKLRFIKTL